jgi:hypothetical protein
MAGTVNPISHAWYPGQVMVGGKVNALPEVFTQPVVFQAGIATQVNGAALPVITAPGTVVSAGTVTNSTGFDAMVYASATTGIQKIVFPGIAAGTIAGTTPAAQTVPFYLPNNQQVAVTYTGTLTWTWLAI